MSVYKEVDLITEGTVLTQHPAARALTSRGVEGLVGQHLEHALINPSRIVVTPTRIEKRDGWLVEVDSSDYRWSLSLTVADVGLVVSSVRTVDDSDPFAGLA